MTPKPDELVQGVKRKNILLNYLQVSYYGNNNMEMLT